MPRMLTHLNRISPEVQLNLNVTPGAEPVHILLGPGALPFTASDYQAVLILVDPLILLFIIIKNLIHTFNCLLFKLKMLMTFF
jgi:hypothetical protein